MLAPLYMKYESKSGQRYVYDRGSNEILRVGRVVYEILDDYRVLKPGEIVEKHRELGEARVRDALAELDALQARGILRDHAPQVQSRADEIVCEGEEESLEGILRNRRRSLTLELTQQCNLRCDYCCYGGLYANKRVHNDSRMSLETARNAVDRFLEPNPESCRIGFYGGEPLLEFDLLREVVAYAKEVAAKKGNSAFRQTER